MSNNNPRLFYIPIEGYRHMYRSLMRYFNLSRMDAAGLSCFRFWADECVGISENMRIE